MPQSSFGLARGQKRFVALGYRLEQLNLVIPGNLCPRLKTTQLNKDGGYSYDIAYLSCLWGI